MKWFLLLPLFFPVIGSATDKLMVEAGELFMWPASQTALFQQSVSITHQGLQINAEQVKLALDEAEEGGLSQVEANGNVMLFRGEDHAQGDRLVYQPQTQQAVLTGNVSLLRAGTTLRGAKLTYSVATGELHLEQGEQQRISAEVVKTE